MEIEDDYFNVQISRIDEFLASNEVPVHARPIRATIEFLKKLGVDGPIAGVGLETCEKPIKPTNLSSHIQEWYQLRYSEKLKVDMTQAKFPFLINGDVFEVKVPTFLGKMLVVALKSKNSNKSILNPLDMVVDLTDHLRNSMSSRDVSFLQVYFETCLSTALVIRKARENELISSAYKDSFVSCEALINLPRSPELSAWHAVQFAEKILKYFITLKQETAPKTHSFDKLVKISQSLGYKPDPRLNWELLSSITPDVRYVPGNLLLNDAVLVNLEAWRVGYNVLHQIDF